jgi:hypothetical protein
MNVTPCCHSVLDTESSPFNFLDSCFRRNDEIQKVFFR